MKTNVITIILISLTLSACAFSTEESRKKAAEDKISELGNAQRSDLDKRITAEVQSGSLNASDISVKFEYGPVPGVYKFILSWPERIREVYVEHNGIANTYRQVTEYSGVINHSTKVTIYLTSRDSNRDDISRIEYEVVAPEDLIVDNDIFLSGDAAFNVKRVYFYPGKSITTNGHSLKISADLIQVADIDQLCMDSLDLEFCKRDEYPSKVNIHTTVVGTKRPPNMANPQISIQTKNAEGLLRIAAIGFDGHDGLSGDALNKRSNVDPYAVNLALKGADGRAAKIKHIGGSNSCGGFRDMDIPCEPSGAYCEVQPTSGENGRPGAKGTAGLPGEVGGSSGDIFVRVTDRSDFTVKIWQRPGLGGKGGEGAPGFVGGLGGAAGQHHSPCVAAKAGEQGPQGKTGENGPNGSDGQKGQVQITGAHSIIMPL